MTPEEVEARRTSRDRATAAPGWTGRRGTLTSPQNNALAIIKEAGEDCSLCCTNPLVHTNPIIFVNAQWQLLTGLTDQQAQGRPASLMQGHGTDKEVTASIRLALSQRRACKALPRL